MALPERVLIVEDSSADAALVDAHLRAEGHFAAVRVDTLSAARDWLRNEETPDVVVLDLNLPDSTGLATLTTVRALFPELPVVILCGNPDDELAINAVDAGAQDYLLKSEVNSRTLTRALRYAIERNRRFIAERSLQKTERDFDIARRIQTQMLPCAAPQIDGYDIAGRCDPAAATGGDFFDFIEHDDGSLDIVVADVSSHGFAPALIMAGTRRSVRTLAQIETDLGAIATHANTAVWEDTLEDQFVTMFFARFEPASRRLRFVTAGHPAWRIDPNGASERLVGPNPPLGVEADWTFQASPPATLREREMLLFLTDGVWEAHTSTLDMFGISNIVDVVHANRELAAAEILDRLFESVLEFSGEDGLNDDLTAVLLKCDAG